LQWFRQALKKAGFDPGKIDGYAGDKTWEALKRFSKSSEGLKAGWSSWFENHARIGAVFVIDLFF
jgi:hypothetical protein